MASSARWYEAAVGARRSALAALLCGSILGATGQARAQTADAAAPHGDEVYIENVTPRAVTFGLSHDDRSWQRLTLKAGKVAVYGSGKRWYFVILTEGVELRYRLIAGDSYRIYWNDIDKRWDLMTCEKPACGRKPAQP